MNAVLRIGLAGNKRVLALAAESEWAFLMLSCFLKSHCHAISLFFRIFLIIYTSGKTRHIIFSSYSARADSVAL